MAFIAPSVSTYINLVTFDEFAKDDLKNDRADVILSPFVNRTTVDVREQSTRLNQTWFEAIQYDAPRTLLCLISLFRQVGLSLPGESVELAWEYDSLQVLAVLHEYTEFKSSVIQSVLKDPRRVPKFCEVCKSFEEDEKLLLACRGGHLETFKSAYDPQAKINQHAMELALVCGSYSILVFLYEQGHEVGETFGFGPLVSSTVNPTLQPIFEHHAKKYPQKMLAHAINKASPYAIKKCLDLGATPTSLDIALAAERCSLDLVEVLLDHGGKINHSAIFSSLPNPAMLKLLLKRGGKPASHHVGACIRSRHVESLQVLLDYGLSATKEDLQTAFYISLDAAELIMKRGLRPWGVLTREVSGQQLLRKYLPTVWDHLDEG